MRVAFITNFCPHYRVKTFETFSKYHDLSFYFFSPGKEWYWQDEHGVAVGGFKHQYLWGFYLGRTRIVPTLPFKLFFRRHDVYIKCILGRFALPATYLVARLKRKPLILWTGVWRRLGTPMHRLMFPLTRYIYRHADAIVVYGEHVKRYLVEEGVSEERIFVARHAVDNEVYYAEVSLEKQTQLRRALDLPDGNEVVLYLGRLEESKGLDYLIEAFASIERHDVTLLLVGAGSWRSKLEQLVDERRLADRVRFVGYVPTAETPPYYSIASLFVLPSVTTPADKEPWGLVVNEAFNRGLPVVATDAVGAAAGGLVVDQENGFIVPERDSNALAGAIGRLLDDRSLRKEFGERAKKEIANWGNEQMILGFRQAVEYVTNRQKNNRKGSPSTHQVETV